MLVAMHKTSMIEARAAIRNAEYECPKCRSRVTLKQGTKVVHHYAHRPPVTCAWGQGESQEHMASKYVVCDWLRNLGFEASCEVPILSGGGDRRADVFVNKSKFGQFAIEVQHTTQSESVTWQRTKSYAEVDIGVAWVGVLTKKMKDQGQLGRYRLPASEGIIEGMLINEYSIRPWESWATRFHRPWSPSPPPRTLWFVEPVEKVLWRGIILEYWIEVPLQTWYQEGEERSAGGYVKKSKRWRRLVLEGPMPPATVDISSWSSNARVDERDGCFFPAARRIAFFRKNS